MFNGKKLSDGALQRLPSAARSDLNISQGRAPCDARNLNFSEHSRSSSCWWSLPSSLSLKFNDMLKPGPSLTWVLMDGREDRINHGNNFTDMTGYLDNPAEPCHRLKKGQHCFSLRSMYLPRGILTSSGCRSGPPAGNNPYPPNHRFTTSITSELSVIATKSSKKLVRMVAPNQSEKSFDLPCPACYCVHSELQFEHSTAATQRAASGLRGSRVLVSVTGIFRTPLPNRRWGFFITTNERE